MVSKSKSKLFIAYPNGVIHPLVVFSTDFIKFRL